MKVAFAVLLALAGAGASPVVPPAGAERVAWLEGCWLLASNGRTVEEHWMAPRGNSMMGMGRTVRADTLADYELLIIRASGERLALEAHPKGQPSAVFPAVRVDDAYLLFENPEHDFPQRIGYRRAGSDSLIAWIEGTINGKERRVEFPFQRVTCPGK